MDGGPQPITPVRICVRVRASLKLKFILRIFSDDGTSSKQPKGSGIFCYFLIEENSPSPESQELC